MKNRDISVDLMHIFTCLGYTRVLRLVPNPLLSIP